MIYTNIRKKLNKFYDGGKILKYQYPQGALPGTFDGLSDGNGNVWNAAMGKWILDPNKKLTMPNVTTNKVGFNPETAGVTYSYGDPNSIMGQTTTHIDNDGNISTTGNNTDLETTNSTEAPDTDGGQGISDKAKGLLASAAVGAVKTIDQMAMGDKKFGAQSLAIDSAVHGVSSALMSSGNPYAMAAGAALEGANFLTKAGGQTVQGFDVDIDNSGYGNLGHMESSSSRDFGAMLGLGGLNGNKMLAKLARRNEQVKMALAAAAISQDLSFEQEARMNNVDNVLRNNQIALAGGINTSLLGS